MEQSKTIPLTLRAPVTTAHHATNTHTHSLLCSGYYRYLAVRLAPNFANFTKRSCQTNKIHVMHQFKLCGSLTLGTGPSPITSSSSYAESTLDDDLPSFGDESAAINQSGMKCWSLVATICFIIQLDVRKITSTHNDSLTHVHVCVYFFG